MLTDADRHELYENLREWLGERPATLFMTTISPHDPDDVATRAFVRSEFEAFYRRHVDAITVFHARRVDDPHTVADLVAEVFMAVLDSARTYKPALGHELAWLYGVARNTLSSERRRTFKEARLTSRVGGRRVLDTDDVARLEERIDAERSARKVLQAMSDLSERDRAVLELVVVDQLTVTEAATALGIRPGTANVRLHRARRKLQALPLVMEGTPG